MEADPYEAGNFSSFGSERDQGVSPLSIPVLNLLGWNSLGESRV